MLCFMLPPCSCLQACKCVTTEPRVSQESVSIKTRTLTLRCAAHHLLELPVPPADTHILSELNPSLCALAVHLWLFKICKNKIAQHMHPRWMWSTSVKCLLKVQGHEHNCMFSMFQWKHRQLWIVWRLFCATEMLHTKKWCSSYT